MTTEKKLALLEETLEIDEGTLKADMVLDDIEEYDSLARISVIVMMEDTFGVKLSADTVRGFEKVNDILERMK